MRSSRSARFLTHARASSGECRFLLPSLQAQRAVLLLPGINEGIHTTSGHAGDIEVQARQLRRQSPDTAKGTSDAGLQLRIPRLLLKLAEPSGKPAKGAALRGHGGHEMPRARSAQWER